MSKVAIGRARLSILTVPLHLPQTKGLRRHGPGVPPGCPAAPPARAGMAPPAVADRLVFTRDLVAPGISAGLRPNQ